MRPANWLRYATANHRRATLLIRLRHSRRQIRVRPCILTALQSSAGSIKAKSGAGIDRLSGALNLLVAGARERISGLGLRRGLRGWGVHINGWRAKGSIVGTRGVIKRLAAFGNRAALVLAQRVQVPRVARTIAQNRAAPRNSAAKVGPIWVAGAYRNLRQLALRGFLWNREPGSRAKKPRAARDHDARAIAGGIGRGKALIVIIDARILARIRVAKGALWILARLVAGAGVAYGPTSRRTARHGANRTGRRIGGGASNGAGLAGKRGAGFIRWSVGCDCHDRKWLMVAGYGEDSADCPDFA